MIASRTAALTGAAACGNDSVVRDILRPQREGQVRERTDGVGTVERYRVSPPHRERVIMRISKDASRHGHRFAQQ